MYYVFKIFYLCVFMLFYCSLCKVLAPSRSVWSPRPPSLFEAKSQLASPSRDGPVLNSTFVAYDYYLSSHSFGTIIT